MYGTTYVFAHNWRPANTESPIDRQTETQVKDLLASEVPPKG
jgi:hypothetical protein